MRTLITIWGPITLQGHSTITTTLDPYCQVSKTMQENAARRLDAAYKVSPCCEIQEFAAVGWVADRLKAPVLKTGRPVRVSWVRIPPRPPNLSFLLDILMGYGWRYFIPSRIPTLELGTPCLRSPVSYIGLAKCPSRLDLSAASPYGNIAPLRLNGAAFQLLNPLFVPIGSEANCRLLN